jgi:hypothetical protein
MNTADKAIEKIRAVRHRISAAHGHDVGKYLAHLRVEEDQHAPQLERGRELLARRRGESRKYPAPTSGAVALRERPKT